MNIFKKIFAVAAVAASTIGAGSQAARADDWGFYAKNNTQRAIWITVYLYGSEQQKKDWFCILPGQEHKSTNSNYSWRNYAYVRAEVKHERDTCAKSNHKWDLKNNGLALNGQGRAMISFNAGSFNEKPWVDAKTWH